MKANNLNKNIIQSILKKAIQCMQENPEREIRNLVDIGVMFAKGHFQKQFFLAAEKELAKENSRYYKLVTQSVRKTDKEALLSFGINLGYNSLTYGANTIRDFEKQSGFHVPWVLYIQLSDNGCLDTGALDSLILQGEKIGIYSYILIIQTEFSKTEELGNLIKSHKDCAFMLLAGPDWEASHIDVLQKLNNLFVGVDISSHGREEIMGAVNRLRKAKILCGAFCPRTEKAPFDMEKAALETASYECELIFVLDEYSFFMENQEQIKKTLYDMRFRLTAPAIPFDLMADTVVIDRNISSEGCLALVSENGRFHVTDMETGKQNDDYSIMDTDLETILSRTLPKQPGP